MRAIFDPIKNFDILPDSAVVRDTTVIAVLGIGRATWWKGVADEIYPPALKLGPRSVGWRVSDIRRILENLPLKTEKDANAASAVTARRSNIEAKRALIGEVCNEH